MDVMDILLDCRRSSSLGIQVAGILRNSLLGDGIHDISPFFIFAWINPWDAVDKKMIHASGPLSWSKHKMPEKL